MAGSEQSDRIRNAEFFVIRHGCSAEIQPDNLERKLVRSQTIPRCRQSSLFETKITPLPGAAATVTEWRR